MEYSCLAIWLYTFTKFALFKHLVLMLYSKKNALHNLIHSWKYEKNYTPVCHKSSLTSTLTVLKTNG